MKIKVEYFKWFDNKPLLTEFEGTMEEFEKLLNKGYVIPDKEMTEIDFSNDAARDLLQIKNKYADDENVKKLCKLVEENFE